MVKIEHLSLLRCPENHTRLSPASADTLNRLNAAIREGRLVNCAGHILDKPIDAALIREDGAILYPIVDDIPVLLRDDAILLEQIEY
jgi:uncharacterized protein YbaR (Trm112 family)